jgi:hypothetical protein
MFVALVFLGGGGMMTSRKHDKDAPYRTWLRPHELARCDDLEAKMAVLSDEIRKMAGERNKIVGRGNARRFYYKQRDAK